VSLQAALFKTVILWIVCRPHSKILNVVLSRQKHAIR
jgi:hypothetical protein